MLQVPGAPLQSPPGQSMAYAFLSTDSQRRINQIVKAAALPDSIHSKPYLTERKIIELTLEDTCSKATTKNQSIQISNIDHIKSQQDVIEKDSVFDPVFNFSLGYTVTDTYDRSEYIGRWRRGFTDFEQLEESLGERVYGDEAGGVVSDTDSHCPGCVPCVYIGGVLINPDECDSEYEYTLAREFASVRLRHGTIPDALVGTFGIEKELTWGSTLHLTFETAHRDRENPPLGDYAGLYTYEGSHPFGRNPWSSSLALNLKTPLPFSKDFGAYGTLGNVNTKLARANKTQKQWEKSAVTNDILTEVQITYWTLVRDLVKLQIVMDARINLKKMAVRTEALFLEGSRTAYEKAQVEAELTITKNREEITWSDIAVSSNRLAELLGMSPSVLIIPIRYGKLLKQSIVVDPEKSLHDAIRQRPDLKVVQSEFESSNILFKYRQNQILPDLKLHFNLSLGQIDTYYGYSDITDSWANLFNPDHTFAFVSLVYRWPIGNRAAKSALQRERVTRKQNKSRLILKKNEIIDEINRAIASAKSTEVEIASAESNFRLKKLTYEKALKLRETFQEISEFELLRQYNDFINSQLGLLDALIRHRISQIELMAARGEFSGG